MTASDALRNFLLPLLPGWRIQFGRWMDGATSDRYAVIRPAGGLPAALVRQPQFTLVLIGALNEPATVPQERADAIIEAMRLESGDVVLFQAGEPVFMNTDDGRPVFEIAVSAITN
jgi:hypothetical protein